MNLGPSKWAEPYIGVPFQQQGFSLEGCHCWGLVWLVYQQELQKELNKYLTYTAANLRQAVKLFKGERCLDPWREISGPDITDYVWKDFDVVMMLATERDKEKKRLVTLDGHVGVVAGRRRVLHVAEDICTSCMDANHPRIRGKILGIYRHKDLM